MTEYNFNIGTHTEQAHSYVNALIDEAYKRKAVGSPTTPQERVDKSDRLCEAHWTSVGQMPSHSVLTRLAGYIVFDELVDDHPDKVSREEYPILNSGQIRRRERNTVLRDELPYGDVRFLGKRVVTSSMVTDDGEDKNEYHPHIDCISLVDQREDEYDDLLSQLTFDELASTASLTDGERVAIIGTYDGGLKQGELADQMGVSQARISQLINSALDKIRRVIAG